jgi:DNA repair photolyase
MSRRAVFVPYRPKHILNKGKRADHWFWTRYSAHPYIGCQHGCDFCYSREQKYSPYDNPDDFAYVIKVKENAPDLLRRALGHVPVDLTFTGDYQPAERKFGLSRQMLEVCLDLGFPVFILERSPLVLRDLDLVQEINVRAPSIIAFSIISTPDAPSYDRARTLERLSPSAEKRFAAMAEIAKKGILTGTCLMPILPGISDDEVTLESVVRWTKEHGGRFALPGSMTLSDQQRDYFLRVLHDRFPEILDLYRATYPPGSYAPAAGNTLQAPRRVRELCQKHGLPDRIPRPIIPGDKRALNRRIVEVLANQVYAMELDGQSSHRVWAYRRAAWAIEDLDQDIALVHRTLGLKGLQSIPNVGSEIAEWLRKEQGDHEHPQPA